MEVKITEVTHYKVEVQVAYNQVAACIDWLESNDFKYNVNWNINKDVVSISNMFTKEQAEEVAKTFSEYVNNL